MLRRGFVDDERTAQMREDGWLNLSVIPIESLTRVDFEIHASCRQAAVSFFGEAVAAMILRDDAPV